MKNVEKFFNNLENKFNLKEYESSDKLIDLVFLLPIVYGLTGCGGAFIGFLLGGDIGALAGFSIVYLITAVIFSAVLTIPSEKSKIKSNNYFLGSFIFLSGLLIPLILIGFLFLPFVLNFLSLIIILIGSIVLAELIFLKFDNTKPKRKQSIFWFTVNRKIEAIVEGCLIILSLVSLINFGRISYNWSIKNWNLIGQFIGVVGFISIALIVFFVYIKLNSLKYRNIKKKKNRRDRK